MTDIVDELVEAAKSCRRQAASAIRMNGSTAVMGEAYQLDKAAGLHEAASAEIERLRLSLSEARATGRREGMEAMTDALNDDALTKRAADFLLERDQQTTQAERDDGERETSAFIILQMGAAAIRAAMEK